MSNKKKGKSKKHIANGISVGNVLPDVDRLVPLKVFGNDYPTKDGTCVRDYIHVVDLPR